MHPILFEIGSLTLYTYGLMLGLGFAAGGYGVFVFLRGGLRRALRSARLRLRAATRAKSHPQKVLLNEAQLP